MKAFNEENFTELLLKCNNNIRYRGVIILPTLSEVRQFTRELYEIHRVNPINGTRAIGRGFSTCCKNFTGRILFKNNSLIDVMVPGESMRGIRCNDILCSIPLEPNVLDMVRSRETEYRSAWHKEYYCEERKQLKDDPMDNIADTAELDNFLNEFVVNS